MKKVLTTLLAFGVLSLFALPIYADKSDVNPDNGGSHSKATGKAALIKSTGETGDYVEFNAHDTDPVKGQIHWWRISNDEIKSDFYAEVTAVTIHPKDAYMEGVVYKSTFSNVPEGAEFKLQIWDKSSPGSDELDPDKAVLKWTTEPFEFGTYYVLDGDFVVHQKVLPTETAGPVPTATPLIPGLYIPE
jgi:hypothetical protein